MPPSTFGDRICGLYVANAVTAALYHRAMTGEGQEIEVPMFETMAQFVLADHMGGGAFSPPEGEMGYRRLLSRTRGPYSTRDGHLSLVVYTDRHWRSFTPACRLPRPAGHGPALRHAGKPDAQRRGDRPFLEGHLPERTNAEWLDVLHGVDIPACPVNSIEALFEDPHLAAVNFFETAEHPTEGALTVCRFPVRFSRSPASVRRLAPNLGEHNAEVLGEPEMAAATV